MSQRTGAFNNSSGFQQNIFILPLGLKYKGLRHGMHIILCWNTKGNIKGQLMLFLTISLGHRCFSTGPGINKRVAMPLVWVGTRLHRVCHGFVKSAVG